MSAMPSSGMTQSSVSRFGSNVRVMVEKVSIGKNMSSVSRDSLSRSPVSIILSFQASAPKPKTMNVSRIERKT